METIKKGWVQWLISACITIILFITAQSISTRKESKLDVRSELKTKASIEYVDQQDQNLEKMLEQHSKQSTELMQSMDHKIDILLSRVPK